MASEIISNPWTRSSIRRWICPFCNTAGVLSSEITDSVLLDFDLDNADGRRVVRTQVIVCPNPDCRRYALSAVMYQPSRLGDPMKLGADHAIKTWLLVPESTAKIYPDYIPSAIRQDYVEACAIQSNSPKAAATLARRALQGMIRDYFGVSKSRLVDEIEAIKDKVEPSTWDAIDAVRSVGNIGAHMEKDVNLIIDVSEEEARQLIELLEMLFEDWYVSRHEREQRTQRVIALGQSKNAAKQGKTNP